MTAAKEQFQFLHLEHYGLSASAHPRSKKGYGNVQGVVDEALRRPHACKHVGTPKPPVFLIGSFDSVAALPSFLVDATARLGDDAAGMRSDTPVLLSLVVSYPSKVIDEGYAAWESDTVAFLQRQFGPRLLAVIRHGDESYLHLHGLVANEGRRISPIHPGYAAGGTKRSPTKLKRFHDLYHAEVGASHGLKRMGPERARTSKAADYRQHRELQASIEELARRESELKAGLLRLEAETALAEEGRDRALEKKRAADDQIKVNGEMLGRVISKLQQSKKDLAREVERHAERVAELDAREETMDAVTHEMYRRRLEVRPTAAR